ncbi:MAG: hypothetical protein QOJ64_1761 [Acidobacteriota bacterium]|jgi:hypothetical protein|nr:hypothetical protein [Acidobacteriota bacterium]
MADEEIQLNAQRSLQEYDDAVQNLAANYAELGRKAVAALDEFIGYWKKRPELSEAAPSADQETSDMQKYAERQLEWAEHEKQRVVSQLSKGAGTP